MDTFSLAVNGWHDFYLMVGTAAATLVGLLFVSFSLNADVIANPANAEPAVCGLGTRLGRSLCSHNQRHDP